MDISVREYPKAMLMGIPVDCGEGGTIYAPERVRAELLELPGHEDFFDLGDIGDISAVEEELASLYGGYGQLRILGLGGDDSVHFSLIKPYLEQKRRQNIMAAVFCFDAVRNLQIGVGDDEKRQCSAEEITRLGSDTIAASLRGRGVQELYVSFDMSVLSTHYARAVQKPQGKLSLDTILVVLKKLTSQFPLTGADLVEISPFFSKKGGMNPEPDATLAIGAMVSNFFLTELNRSIRT